MDRRFQAPRVPRGGGRGREHAHGPGDRERKIFTKLVRDKDATMSTMEHARRFLVGMGTFESKPELLTQLDDDRNFGKKRIGDVMSFINSLDDVRNLLMPLIRHVMTEETNRPLYRPLRDRILFAIYNVPGLFLLLDNRKVASALDEVSAGHLCSFLRAVTKAYIEPRESDVIIAMAKDLRSRHDVDEAGVLCSFLLVDERDSAALAARQGDAALRVPSASICWVSDMVPPGGRHDNDHLNYRNIQVLPTVNELASTVASYLPLANGKNHFIDDPVVSLLDGNFRLLREDAVSTMRETLRDDSSRHTWANARIIGVDIGSRLGQWAVSFVVQCEGRKDGNPNWERSREFALGTVVALCRDGQLIRLGTITIREHEAKDAWLNAKGGPKIGVVFADDTQACLDELSFNSALNEEYKKVVARLLGRPDRKGRLLKLVSRMRTFELKEISKSFFSYRPILEALQDNESTLLLSDLTETGGASRPDYLPDQIVLPADFGGHEVNELSMHAIVKSTTLDASQAAALYHAFNSNIAMIQGPPGTGKTFLGALVTRTIRENTDETVLCVCYTNHALDQFLEHMLSAGETRLVRIGARSKSEQLEGYSLKNLAHRTNGGEQDFCQRRIKQVTAQMFSLKEKIEKAVKELLEPCHWEEISHYLYDMDEDCLKFLQAPGSDGGFKIVGPGGKDVDDEFVWVLWNKGYDFPDWLLPHMDIPGEVYQEFLDFWKLSLDEREVKIVQWKTAVRRHEAAIIAHCTNELNALSQEKKSLSVDRELVILKEARIIGATTSGAASYRDLLALASPAVVLVEEAGEVLEAHILTSLSTASKHLIMIGDHLQLPPKVEQYNLTATSGHGYNLDCSLFERLVQRSWPSVTLEVQHRMRPSISALVREQTYPALKDHESVLLYPDVKGVTDNLIFVDHRHAEDGEGTEDLNTKSNSFEANLTIEIVRYFLLQGYTADKIVVLTPYLGQLIKLVALIKANLKEATVAVSERDMADVEHMGDSLLTDEESKQSTAGSVRCSSIDNFQGEEADIIVVSLVRSNSRGIIGFLKEKQRVNVLLSRARHGMFIVGNSATLRASRAGRSAWDTVLRQLDEGGRLMDGFPTTCHLHPEDDAIVLRTPDDFRTFRPNGGCNRPCNVRLDCGHACPLFCHPSDRAHIRTQMLCCEPCKRFPEDCQHQHTCPKLCKDKCGRCMSFVGSRLLPCEHISDDIRCFEEHELRSEELMTLLSGRCIATVLHTYPVCGHSASLTCAKSRNPQQLPVCGTPCEKVAKCGHPCSSLCGACTSLNDHTCAQNCEKVLFCGHSCGRVCHIPDACAPCVERCKNQCPHSQCKKVCNEPCASCVEACDWSCEHDLKCSLVCGAPCSRLPCNMRCSKVLDCGHRCPSVCGENCPDALFCHECPGVNKTKVVDMICFTRYEDHNVDDDPIIVLPCRHFFAASTLDGHLQINTVYKTDETGSTFTGLKSLIGTSTGVGKPSQCPECRSLIHSVRRYGRVLRLMELRSLERKHVMVVGKALVNLSGHVGNQAATQKVLDTLQQLEQLIRKSPMRKIFEACGGEMEMDMSPPPPGPLIRCLELLGTAHGGNCATYNDDHFVKAKAFFEQAIDIANQSLMNRSGGQLRLALSSLVAKHCREATLAKQLVTPLLDWIINHPVRFEDLIASAQTLKTKVLAIGTLSQQEMQEVVSAMSYSGGYNYGGTASSHWFECPNGHPYFIGECGGAMQTSYCYECRQPVGGNSHTLLSTNRSATGALRNAMVG